MTDMDNVEQEDKQVDQEEGSSSNRRMEGRGVVR